MELDAGVAQRVRRVLGAAVTGAVPIGDRGYANNRRWLVRLADGRTGFVKLASDAPTADWLRREHHVYRHLPGGLHAEVLGWDDDGELPLLALEDLSGQPWPPPWDAGRVAAVRATLAELASLPPIPDLPRAGETGYGTGTWADVADDPGPLLSLGLCSPGWLERALPVLLDAARPELMDGPALVHLDVRSDNMCFRAGRAVLVDWNLTALGNPQFDLAFWLPSLQAEGGPEPEAVAAVEPGVAALVAGFFAARAGLPDIPVAPRVRAVQRVQLATALPWVARALELPPPA